ncbi:MAG: sdhB [Chloroflexi bacterium]|nr:sdhB [Chloroflexota bacterium]
MSESSQMATTTAVTSTTWKVTFHISRQKGSEPRRFDSFVLDVRPDEYVLDAVERVWAFHDRTLCFAHACHHSTCGACGMRVNDAEKLTCITPINSVTHDGGVVKIEPLRNFPVVSDLAVDMGALYRKMDLAGHHSVVSELIEPAEDDWSKQERESHKEFIRLSDCIECGLCISVCPAAATNVNYIGPAPLAGAYQHGLDHDIALLQLVDSDTGLWRCHSAFECSAVCPSNVNPAAKIMELRRQVFGMRFKSWFGGK